MVSSSPSRAGVEGCPETHAPAVRIRIETPPVSWLGGRSRKIRDCGAAFPSRRRIREDSANGSVARAENFSALQSRGGDGFSPSSLARSLLWLWTALLVAGSAARGGQISPR